MHSTSNHPLILNLFLELAQINGPSGQETDVAAFIKQYLGNLGLAVTEDEAHTKCDSAVGNLTCRVGTGGDTLLLAHMDTVRPTRDLQPVVLTDRITSSGDTILGADNRAGVAILLSTIRKAVENPEGYMDFSASFTICEETHLTGSKLLEVDPSIEMAYAFDSGYRPGHVIHGSYGAQSFAIEVQGRAAHAGLAPEKGINAIWVAAQALAQLETGRLEDQSTLNFATIEGGSTTNVVPDSVLVKGETRALTQERGKEIVQRVFEIFDRVTKEHGAGLECSSKWEFTPFGISEDSAIYIRVMRAMEQVGLTPKPLIAAGGSDANSLNDKGVPAINLGIGAQNCHSNEEFILIEDLLNAEKIAEALLRK
ncbi:M20/M25/M40 family metallo-hydrolase [Candidatus Neomarinimicrobiota bacterium]